MTTPRPLTVAALTQRIAASLTDLGTLSVQGELSMVKVAPSGHLYATLKDSEAVISLVMWRSTVVRQGAIPKEGAQVVVRGSLSVYGPRGQYQLTATRIETVGAGDLAARFEALKARLAAEGLFEEDRKRALPFLPKAVGVATAAGSAALADILDSLRSRFPSMTIVHAPCLVQGAGAAASIVAALGRLARDPRVEVIICGRGGGSLEDLWAFNEEAVVRAIAACPVPIVSAVGHETDTTLADFVADLRAKTPTMAAELVVPVEADLRAEVADLRRDLDQALGGILVDLRTRLAALESHRALTGPAYQINLRRQRLDEMAARLEDGLTTRLRQVTHRHGLAASRLRGASPRGAVQASRVRLETAVQRLSRDMLRRQERQGERLAAAAARLDALSPLGVIARGYSVVRTPGRVLVRSCADAPPGTVIEARMSDGWLTAVVEGSRRQRLNEPESGYDVG